MFVDAVEEASAFTLPAIEVAYQPGDGVSAGVATCILLNDEGWFVTASHVLANLPKAVDGGAFFGQPPRMYAFDPLLPILPADLILGRLVDFDTSTVESFPRFKNPDALRVGTSLAIYGYAAQQASVTRTGPGRFQFHDTDPFSPFACEGIHGRTIPLRVRHVDYPISVIELSCGGYPGQSGGPVIDRDGAVHGVFIQTSARSKKGEPDPVTGEDISLVSTMGWAIHSKTIQILCERNGVEVEWVD